MMAIDEAAAANDGGAADPPSEGLEALMSSIVEALDHADKLNLPLVAIHLDHALALCHKGTADGGDE